MSNKITILFGCLLMLASCDSTLEDTYSSQAENISKCVEAQQEAHPEYTATYDKGVVRLTVFEGQGEELDGKGSVSVYYAGYLFSGNMPGNSSKPFATNISDLAAQAGFDMTDESAYEPVRLNLEKDGLLEGLKIGLKGVKAGEDCYIFFCGDKAYGKKQTGTIPANSALVYHVQVVGLGD